MRFQKSFTRVVASGGTTTLGADAAPTAEPNARTPPNNNQFSASLCNTIGFPVQRVAVAFKGPAGAVALPATLYMWDDLTEHWYQLGDVATLVPNRVAVYRIPIVGPFSHPAAYASSGAVSLCLVVTSSTPGPDPDGTYVFAFGLDCAGGGAA